MEWYRNDTLSQEEINALSYPCTHEYLLDTLEPIGDLKRRMDILPHEFFTGNNFLDIGCNKGFFSLLAKRKCKYVESIEPTQEYYELCVRLGLNVKNVNFRDYTTEIEFDRVMLGNVVHYLFRESGWDFIKKLACIAIDLVLVECPTEWCSDLKDMFPGYNYGIFKDEMDEYFDIITETDSPSPDRKIILFKRKEDEFTKRYELKDLNLGETIKDDSNSKTYSSDFITKIYPKINKNAIKIASLSPISNGLTGFVYDGDKCVGWCEDKLEGRLLEYKEKQIHVFKKICEHETYLARVGYFDYDTSMINFINLLLFDKGGVIPISDITEDYVYKFDIMLRNSYDILADGFIEKLEDVIITKNSEYIEGVFNGNIT